MGSDRRCNSGKSTYAFRHRAWKVAKRSVMPRNFSRTSPRCSSPLRRPKSARLLEQTSLRRKRSEEHTSELQSPDHLVCRLLLEKKNTPYGVPTRLTGAFRRTFSAG